MSSTDNKSSLDTTLCPLCGGPNSCAMAADPSATACWCETVSFPRELLEQIPASAVRKTCVCKKCLEAFQLNSKVSDI